MKKTFLLSLSSLAIYCLSYATPPVAENKTNKFGEKVNICGKVTGSKGPVSNTAKSTIITITDAEATSFNVVIKQDDRKNFGYKPEEYLYNKNVCVTGILGDYFGRTELFIRRPEEIKIEEIGGGSEIRPFDFDIFNRFMQEED